ncbi:hypothetical protein NKDENANG_00069 [Candidatus Entotheonellaceae bacterium PAL068K]
MVQYDWDEEAGRQGLETACWQISDLEVSHEKPEVNPFLPPKFFAGFTSTTVRHEFVRNVFQTFRLEYRR